MRTTLNLLFLFLLFTLRLDVNGQDMFIGLAKKSITPSPPIWLTGYASRTTPATGVVHDLWAKAIYLESSPKEKAIIISTDLLGLSREVHHGIVQQLASTYGLSEKQIIINSSHTHSGPMIWPALSGIADYHLEDQRAVSTYTLGLINKLVELAGESIHNKEKMTLSLGHGQVDFAINRRQLAASKIGKILAGPIDHDVPVIQVKNLQGQVKGILVGYACHNTTVQGDNYLVNGDYAGFAQIEIEKKYPQAIAMFILGCAGDQNPEPRGSVALAEKHGKKLAETVHQVLQNPLKPIGNSLRYDAQVVTLDFQKTDINSYQKELVGEDIFKQRRAKLMLEALNKGWNISQYQYPIQALRIGKEFTLVALAGEVVVDYSLRIKREFAQQDIFVAGYSQEVMCYIPSKNVLQEGGYEAESSMIYYGWPGPFADTVEDKIMQGVYKLMKNVGIRRRP
ncbi:neutral/alkaline non-lysosomal ceramidase N-terminal domain-containing protein [Aquirufa ecclesiirivi]